MTLAQPSATLLTYWNKHENVPAGVLPAGTDLMIKAEKEIKQ